MKTYEVTIAFTDYIAIVEAKNEDDAKKKALAQMKEDDDFEVEPYIADIQEE